MNYQDHYDRLISRAKERKLDCYSESHHIVPKCMGGTDDKDNLILLTAREHFIAHLLLMKIHPESYGLVKAVNMMCMAGENQDRTMNRMYGWLKDKFSKEMSRSQAGANNSNYGNCWVSNRILKVTFQIPKNKYFDYMLEGFEKRRIMKFIDPSECVICGKLTYNKSLTCSNLCNVKMRKNNGTYINSFKDKKHTCETINNMVGHTRNCGENNPMYGARVMYNKELDLSRKIIKKDIEEFQKNGWVIGNKIV